MAARQLRGNALSNDEAVALFQQLEGWLRVTGTCWAKVAAEVGVSQSIKSRVFTDGKGLAKVNAAAIRKVMDDYPDGLPRGDDRGSFLSMADTALLARDIRDWLHRTGTPLAVLARSVNRSEDTLRRMLADPVRMGCGMAVRYRKLMEANPDRWTPPLRPNQPQLAHPGAAPLPFDPLAERRGEAERLRAERYAELDAEHRRKYGRPLGRRLEEMAA